MLKNKTVRLVIHIGLTFCLAACGSTISRNYKPDPSRDEGILLMSVTSIYSTDMMSGNLNIWVGSFTLQKDGADKPIRLRLDGCYPYWADPGFPAGHEFGCLTPFPLSPGKYELTGVDEPGGGGRTTNAIPYHFGFVIYPGKVTYFGRLSILAPDLSSAYKTGHVTLRVTRLDKGATDIPLFLSSYPQFDQSLVVVDDKGAM